MASRRGASSRLTFQLTKWTLYGPCKMASRVLFCFHDGVIFALHGFIKKTKTTLDFNMEIARNGRRNWLMADNKHSGSTLDSFLEAEGVLGEFQARAIKEVIAWQLAEAMKARKLTKTALALLMKTSRTQINRVLDPNDGNVTIETLQRAAALVGRRVQLELV